MASLIRLSFFFFVLFHAFSYFLPLCMVVVCAHFPFAFLFLEVILFVRNYLSYEDEDNLLQGINSYRRSLNLPALIKNDNAGCLADRIADDIEDLPCSSPTNGANILPSSQSPLDNLPKHLRKCKIDANSTQDGVILPVCVPKLVPTLVLTNYTHSPKYAKYLNDSRFSGVGVGSEDNWAVVVLASSNPSGNFANAAGSLVSISVLDSIWSSCC
ncbi:putative GPI-anchored protein [Prunus yedoensis var. nudiflora]|uniref:Putative GPI-anchored protein n=1 Tax=Prunus yedoensis var. nudiflora TaxID=2094558 RepID=A0A314YSC6_PRUYE|nr:putative GPI-anchored protein [Prunus yedoensis var. nudiflora]